MPTPPKPKPDNFSSRFWPGFIGGLILTVIISPIATWIITTRLADRAEQRLEEKKKKELAEAVAAEKQRMYKQVSESAPEEYVSSLGYLIGKAKADVGDNLPADRVEVSARSIVAARNELRNTMTSLAASLNHEIDELEKALEDLKKNPNDKDAQERVRKTVLVIEQKWPVKAQTIRVQIRKLLTELGLERVLRGGLVGE